MFGNVADLKAFLKEAVYNVYRKQVKSITPVHYDLRTLCENLVSGNHAYFGQLTINRLLWAKHVPQTIPSGGFSQMGFTELYTSFNGKLNQALSINDWQVDQYFGTLGTIQFSNLLFDDILYTHEIFTNDPGNIQYEDTHSKSMKDILSVTAPVIGGGLQYWHVPFMSFIGYKLALDH